MNALTWDRTWDLYIWALFTSPSGMNSAIKIRRHYLRIRSGLLSPSPIITVTGPTILRKYHR